MTGRALIANADDFGQSLGITRGIIEAYERGIVTSASLMVSWPAAAIAAAYARNHAALSIGLHVDLGEWIFRDGWWAPIYERVDCADAAAIQDEVHNQVERCADLLGRMPTHIDSHQHVHRKEPTRSILARVAGDLGVPLRHFAPAIRYCGDFYGQTADGKPLSGRIEIPALMTLLRHLGEGVTELGCHPGYAADVHTMYSSERQVELRTLCAPEVRDALAEFEIRLISFGEQDAA